MQIKAMLTFSFMASMASTSYADWLPTSYFLACKSDELKLTFKINTIFKTVENVNYNRKMNILYWGDEAINTSFSPPKSLSQFVRRADETDNVSINFNRLDGLVRVAGLNAPTVQQVSECEAGRGWGCNDWYVAEIYTAKCEKVEQRF